ncbi:hypothetical protein Dimus_008185, partial [Dionaea muscipula]
RHHHMQPTLKDATSASSLQQFKWQRQPNSWSHQQRVMKPFEKPSSRLPQFIVNNSPHLMQDSSATTIERGPPIMQRAIHIEASGSQSQA